MKKCIGCGTEKETGDFHKNRVMEDGYHSYCKTCRKGARKDSYIGKRKEVSEQVMALRRQKRPALYAYLAEVKSNPCTDCHNGFPPVCMDFDHIGEKKYSIADMVSNGCSLERLKEELLKCELVCANCHRIRTFSRRGSIAYA